MANEAKRDFVKELKRLPSSVFLRQCGMGDFERLKAGAFDVSIQASRTHYSTPRELLPEADAYSAFEVAILRDGERVSPMRDTRFSARPWAELFEDSDISVAGYVPRETVAQILADVEAVPAMTHEKQERIQGQGGAKAGDVHFGVAVGPRVAGVSRAARLCGARSGDITSATQDVTCSACRGSDARAALRKAGRE